jgi:hypothetical protein
MLTLEEASPILKKNLPIMISGNQGGDSASQNAAIITKSFDQRSNEEIRTTGAREKS